MNTIYNVYNMPKDELDTPYVIMFGNLLHGWGCNKNELKEYWSKAIRYSRSKYYGDVSLLYKGKLIRSMNNAEIKILDKDAKYKYMCNKYKIKC